MNVTFSNSLIEAWWRSLKHQWLYLHQLDSVATVRRLVGFYVREHNEVMPHWAFSGLTPDEVYFDKTDGVVQTQGGSGRSAGRATQSQPGGVPELSAFTTMGRTLRVGSLVS